MPHAVSPSKFEILKRQAARLKQEAGIAHSQALDRVATANGFANWSLLAKSVAPQTVQAKPYILPIDCFIYGDPSNNKKPTFWIEEIPTLYPAKHYSEMGWIRSRLGIRQRNREGIAQSLATSRRAIHFMDTTGLKTSRAWTSIFKGNPAHGFDHTSVWRDENKRIVITTEPYFAAREKIEKITQWCNANDWQLVRAPKHVGIWNCCSDGCHADCESHTNMFILAPKKNGGDVRKVLSALI